MEDFMQSVLNCSDSELERIVISRAMELEDNASTDRKFIMPDESLDDYTSYYHGFIKKDVKIYSSLGNSDDECYTLDNYDYLISFFKYVRDNNINSKIDAIKSMSEFMDNYFGEYCGIDKRADFIKSNGGNTTIDIFKGSGLAACSEKAAIANNILSMMGFDSFYMTGEVNGEQHAFNTILTKNNHLTLIDTTSCSGLYDQDNNLIGSATYFFNLGEINDQVESFVSNGTPLSLPSAIARIDDDGKIKYEKNGNTKVYQVEPLLLTEEKSKSK